MIASVITPASRGVEHLRHLIRDFRNQTLPKDLWEHLIVYDGNPPDDVQGFMKEHENDYNIRFMHIEKDTGDMKAAPGTKPRNYGVTQATGSHVYFFDDDDRAKDTLLETLCNNLGPDTISVIQMSCQESRMWKDGDPTRIRLIPEVGLHAFPVICHISTTCFCVPRKWALAEPWRYEPEHDYRFIKRICEKYNPTVRIVPGLQVDTDGLVLQGLRDWVSMPPFYRGN